MPGAEDHERHVALAVEQLEDALERLIGVRNAPLDGVVRGIVYRLIENLGSLPRTQVLRDVRALTKEDRLTLRACGIRVGPEKFLLTPEEAG